MAEAMAGTVTAHTPTPAKMEYKFVLIGPRTGFVVPTQSTVTYFLRTEDGFTPEGSARLINEIREYLSDTLGYIGVSPWEPGLQISRTYDSIERFQGACAEVAAFIRRYCPS